MLITISVPNTQNTDELTDSRLLRSSEPIIDH